ncbi:MAG TPA: hypothetical protein VMU99_01025 [Acidimicrobiales bacterium]|nr:hypothetical protein [Acidimicrobiales bacterium]
MRYRRYVITPKSDGSVTVWSRGPIVALGSWLRLPLAIVFIGAAIAAMLQGQWSTGGFVLLIGALLLPNYAKAKKRAQTAANPASQRDARADYDDPN